MTSPSEILIHHEFDVLQARKAVVDLAKKMGFPDVEAMGLEIVISELGTNIVKYGGSRGCFRFEILEKNSRKGLRIIAEDQGRREERGKEMERMTESAFYLEGLSSSGSLGIGLSGVRRLTDHFTIEDKKDGGVIITVEKWLSFNHHNPALCSVIARPKIGETVSGDAYFIRQHPERVTLAVIDALGHGPEAFSVAQRALAVIENNCHRSPTELVNLCHQYLKNSRGSAMALVQIHMENGRMVHTGIGNVETRIYQSPSSVHPMCMNGTVGVCMPKIKEDTYDCPPGSCVVMFSDGISEKFKLDSTLLRKTPQEIAHHIFQTSARDHDDATVVVVKLKQV